MSTASNDTPTKWTVLDLKLDLMIFDLQTASKYNSDTNLTSEEITKVDDAIVDLQLNLLDNW